MREEIANADARIAWISGRQHGIVTVAQLAGVGIDKSAVARRVRSGRLHRLHQGVYAVGNPRPSQQGHWLAAVFACGEWATLSHTSAAALWGFLKPVRGPIHVTTPSLNGRSRRPGIVLHRSRSLAASRLPQTTERDDIPVTTPQRTIDDLHGFPPYEERRAIRQAELAGYRLDALTRGRTGRTRSDLERAFLRLWARHRVPRPEVNVKVGVWTVDFLWRTERVAVETDFYAYHRGSIAFEEDRRELELRRAGLVVRRYTDKQLDDSPDLVVADLRVALGIGSGQ